MEVPVINLDQETVGTVELSDAVFGLPARADILHRLVHWQLAKRRSGTAKAKGRSEVVGTTKKMYRQKGTGRARHGNAKAPQFRGGGKAFGPVPRDYGYKLPKKVRKLGLKTALSSKLAEGKLVVLDEARVDEPRTKLLRERFERLGWSSVLIVDGAEIDGNLRRAAANLPTVHLLPQIGANVYDILRRDTLVLTRAAVEQLEMRLR